MGLLAEITLPPAQESAGIALIILALGFLIWAIGRLNRRVNIKLPGGFGVDAGRGDGATELATEAVASLVVAQQLRLEQYGEVATALVGVLSAAPGDVEDAAREWFSTLATRLASLLRQKADHHYRVAIWLDDDDGGDFIGVGYGLFDKHDDNMDRLERSYTIGGHAFTSRTGDYYCRDTTTDKMFKPRKTVPPSFRSVYGLALGRLHDPWGVVTVDARAPNGFPEDARLLIRRFGELASLGAVVWATVTGQPPPSPDGPLS